MHGNLQLPLLGALHSLVHDFYTRLGDSWHFTVLRSGSRKSVFKVVVMLTAGLHRNPDDDVLKSNAAL